MTIMRPQPRRDERTQELKEVKAPGAATPVTIAQPGVTYSFNIVLDKAGSTVIAQFHLPLDMHEAEMQLYTYKALKVIELQQLRFDRDKLKVELKLSAAMLDSLKEELAYAKKKRDDEVKRSGNTRVAKPISENLIALDNNLRQNMKRHDAMLADLAQMEKRLAPNCGTDS
jgi:hypothetical protein